MKRMWILLLAFALTASAQSVPTLDYQSGISHIVPAPLVCNYVGNMGPITIGLHLRTTSHGDLTGELALQRSIIDRWQYPRVDRIVIIGNTLSFRVPGLDASWIGTINDMSTEFGRWHTNGSLTGTWHQGSQAQPLNLRNDNTMACDR
jgi:hypothetical protein